MIRKHLLTTTTAMALALALGACGGSNDADSDDAAVDTAAAPEDAPVDPAATDAPDAAVEPVAESADEAPVMEPSLDGEQAMAEPEGAVAEDGDGWTAMQADWDNSAGLVKDRWAELSEEDILGTAGDREQLVVLVQEKYGIARDQAEQEVQEWADAL